MKRILLNLAIIAMAVTANAQKVALHTTGNVQHFTGTAALVNAYNAAVSGDTIYLPGGGFTAPTSIDKSLYIYGAGFYPDSTTVTAKTYIIGNLTLADNADGFYLEGVELTGNILFNNNIAVDNVMIKYCRIVDLNVQGSLATPSNNLTLIDNIFTGDNFYLSNAVNAGVFNCIIEGRVLNSYGNLFENNILMYTYTGATNYYPINGDNNILNNNIFLNASTRYFNGVSNQAYNNIFVASPPNLGTASISSGNYSPVTHTDIFINQSGYVIDYTHDYHLQSPATYLGLDGNEVGLYGGSYEHKEGYVPSNPHFQSKNIAPTTDQDGMLTIELKVAAQNK